MSAALSNTEHLEGIGTLMIALLARVGPRTVRAAHGTPTFHTPVCRLGDQSGGLTRGATSVPSSIKCRASRVAFGCQVDGFVPAEDKLMVTNPRLRTTNRVSAQVERSQVERVHALRPTVETSWSAAAGEGITVG
jgi:hypothetical protein